MRVSKRTMRTSLDIADLAGAFKFGFAFSPLSLDTLRASAPKVVNTIKQNAATEFMLSVSTLVSIYARLSQELSFAKVFTVATAILAQTFNKLASLT